MPLGELVERTIRIELLCNVWKNDRVGVCKLTSVTGVMGANCSHCRQAQGGPSPYCPPPQILFAILTSSSSYNSTTTLSEGSYSICRLAYSVRTSFNLLLRKGGLYGLSSRGCVLLIFKRGASFIIAEASSLPHRSTPNKPQKL